VREENGFWCLLVRSPCAVVIPPAGLIGWSADRWMWSDAGGVLQSGSTAVVNLATFHPKYLKVNGVFAWGSFLGFFMQNRTGRARVGGGAGKGVWAMEVDKNGCREGIQITRTPMQRCPAREWWCAIEGNTETRIAASKRQFKNKNYNVREQRTAQPTKGMRWCGAGVCTTATMTSASRQTGTEQSTIPPASFQTQFPDAAGWAHHAACGFTPRIPVGTVETKLHFCLWARSSQPKRRQPSWVYYARHPYAVLHEAKTGKSAGVCSPVYLSGREFLWPLFQKMLAA